MGKLADLWIELRKTKVGSTRRLEIQRKINDIEKWMIGQGFKQAGTETNWSNYKEPKSMPQKDKYGSLLNPNCKFHVVRIGFDRCGACKYNKNPNCCVTCHESGALLGWCAV